MPVSSSGLTMARKGIAIGMVVISLWETLSWLRGSGLLATIPGAVLGWVMVYGYFSDESKRVVVAIQYLLLVFFGFMFSSSNPDLAGDHAWWAFLFVAGITARKLLERAAGSAEIRERVDRQRKEEQARVEEARRKHREMALRFERERNFQTHATNPGPMTGLEPRALTDADTLLSQAAHLYGKPGEGLAGSGFDQAAIDRGAEGERNLARALAHTGLLPHFASFWSLQMPDESVGASQRFNTDIDAVIVTGRSMWLIDAKNYNQGDVVWSVEESADDMGKDQRYLIAVDRATGGLVGGKRKMSLNMKMAREIFEKRFKETDLRYAIKPVVVLMPRDDGLGEIRDILWAGGIPTVGLPQLIHWLQQEAPFDARDPDAQFLVQMLHPLIKDESGRAWRPGDPLVARAPKAAEATTREQDRVADQKVDAEAERCGDCGAELKAGADFCYECGAAA